MIKMNLNGTTYYVGDGVELRRIWRRAIKKGYYSLYTEEPRYHLSGTYCIFIKKDTIHWDNFNKIAREGIHNYNKVTPYYRWFHGVEEGLQDARFLYENRKMNRKN